MTASSAKPRIAVFAGATATILNTAPLLTANQARRRHGLPELRDAWGRPDGDALRPQRLAAPVTVYVEQFSAHPLERESAHLYAPPDGYMDPAGNVHPERTTPADRPVYAVVLRPEDGLLPLPYMARAADGSAWDGDSTTNPPELATSRQSFFPDAARLFEEIDRVAVDETGRANTLSRLADYDFIRALPPGGYPAGLAAAERTDLGVGDIGPEVAYEDYFPYRPHNLRREPPRPVLARITNRVHRALRDSRYDGALWLEGSPFVEETLYWLNLLIGTEVPIVGCSSPDYPHGSLGAGGDRHIVDAVRYLVSRVWAGEDGRDRVGAVLLSAEQLFTSRDVAKADARAGGYVAAGGHGGIVASTGEPGGPVLSFVPATRHTYRSQVRLDLVPREVRGVRLAGTRPVPVRIAVRDAEGDLLGEAIPFVSVHKHARYLAESIAATPEREVELLARIQENLEHHPLAGFVVEGGAPYGGAAPSADAALRRAALSGMPVVRTARGLAEGYVGSDRLRLAVGGSNLTSIKARLLLMACLLRFGAPPPAADPDHPTDEEVAAVEAVLRDYQAVFDTH